MHSKEGDPVPAYFGKAIYPRRTLNSSNLSGQEGDPVPALSPEERNQLD